MAKGKIFGKIAKNVLLEGAEGFLQEFFATDSQFTRQSLPGSAQSIKSEDNNLEKSKDSVNKNITDLSTQFQNAVDRIGIVSQNSNFDRNQQVIDQKIERLDFGLEPTILFRKVDSNISLIDQKIGIIDNRMNINRGITDVHTDLISKTSIILTQIDSELQRQKILNLEKRLEGEDTSGSVDPAVISDQFFNLLQSTGINERLDYFGKSIGEMQDAINDLAERVDDGFDYLDVGRSGGHVLEGFGKSIPKWAKYGGPLIAGTFAGANEYMDSGDVGKSGAAGIGTAAGTFLGGGLAVGAATALGITGWPLILGAIGLGTLGGFGGEWGAKELYEKFMGSSEDKSNITDEGFFRSNEQMMFEEQAKQISSMGFLNLVGYEKVNIQSISTIDLTTDILHLNGRQVFINGVEVTPKDDGLDFPDVSNYGLGRSSPDTIFDPNTQTWGPSGSDKSSSYKPDEQTQAALDKIKSTGSFSGDNTDLDNLSDELLEKHGIARRYSPRDGTPIYTHQSQLTEEDARKELSKTEGEGTYRPIYSLNDRDLSDAVVNTIAGEALAGNQDSIDGVINNMMNRIGVDGWKDLQDVARANGQYAGYRIASPQEAEMIRARIRAIASGSVPSNVGAATEFRAEYYVKGAGFGKTFERAARAQGYLQPTERDNIYAETFPAGPFGPFKEPKFKSSNEEITKEDIASALESMRKRERESLIQDLLPELSKRQKEDSQNQTDLSQLTGDGRNRVHQDQERRAGTRKGDLQPGLVDKMNYSMSRISSETGREFYASIFSGGQNMYDEDGNWIGQPKGASHEHNDGGAADFEIYEILPDGKHRLLDVRNDDDIEIINSATRYFAESGGRSAGTYTDSSRYMGPNRIHFGVSRNNPAAYRGPGSFKESFNEGRSHFLKHGFDMDVFKAEQERLAREKEIQERVVENDKNPAQSGRWPFTSKDLEEAQKPEEKEEQKDFSVPLEYPQTRNMGARTPIAPSYVPSTESSLVQPQRFDFNSMKEKAKAASMKSKKFNSISKKANPNLDDNDSEESNQMPIYADSWIVG